MIKTDIFVGVCYHKKAPVIKTEVLQPIQVGAALAQHQLDFAIPDNSGVNISDKNKQWCELTAMYWMRHNVDADYYGLMHYRRLLSFSQKIKRDRSFVLADKDDYAKFAWDDQVIRERMTKADVLTPPIYRIHPAGLPDNPLTNSAMYARDHFAKDLDICLDICRTANEEIFPYVLQALKDTRTRFGNIFIMKRELFFEYIDWIFSVLEEAERKIDTSGYDTYQSRVIGFLAERLTEAYFRYAQSTRGAIFEERPVAFAAKPPHPSGLDAALGNVESRLSQPPSVTSSDDGPINLAYAIDEGYTQHAATALHSVLLNANKPDRYHGYILNKGDLSSESRSKLENVAHKFGAKISFVTIPVESLLWLPMNRPHISLTTYYRLIMHKYLPDQVHRILYMDADTLAVAPVEDLWNTDMKGCLIAAAPDEGGVLQSRRLRLGVEHKYFNAGILLFDIDGLRKMDLKGAVLKAFEDQGEFITLQDQDLLNIVFENATAPLDLRWNTNNRLYVKNELDPSYSDDQAAAAAKNPGILHFTDSRKPWHLKCYNPYYELYWIHRNQTPWAETSTKNLKRRMKRFLWTRLNARYRQNTADAQLLAG